VGRRKCRGAILSTGKSANDAFHHHHERREKKKLRFFRRLPLRCFSSLWRLLRLRRDENKLLGRLSRCVQPAFTFENNSAIASRGARDADAVSHGISWSCRDQGDLDRSIEFHRSTSFVDEHIAYRYAYARRQSRIIRAARESSLAERKPTRCSTRRPSRRPNRRPNRRVLVDGRTNERTIDGGFDGRTLCTFPNIKRIQDDG